MGAASRPELATLLPEQLAAITTEPFIAASVARAANARVAAYRVKIEKLPGFEIENLDALGNAGVWCIGRLQTDADCARVLDGLSSAAPNGHSTSELESVVKNLAPRWFLVRDVHANMTTSLLQPRWAMSVLRGPMTRNEIKKALELPVVGSRVPVPKQAAE